MEQSKRKRNNINSEAIKFSQINVYLYAFLLIITPFLMLQNYLQSFIGQLSESKFTFLRIEIPYVILLVFLITLMLIIINRKRITKYNISILLVGLLLVLIGQKSTDYYFNHKFYELQHNWHFIAYGLFALIKYRNLKFRKLTTSKIIINIFFSALLISTFDEIIQVFISSRIFDICDIGKDVWGTSIGIFLILFLLEKEEVKFSKIKLREKNLRKYLKNPLALFIQLILFSYIWLSVSSILSYQSYVSQAIFISLIIYITIFIIIHFYQFKIARVIFIILFILIISVQSFFFIKYSKQNIIYNNNGIICYKGIPILFFDVMIYPNENFRLVDKKHSFNSRDLLKIKSLNSDIILVGSGSENKGGFGFPEGKHPQFIYDSSQNKFIQVIIESNKKAVKTFNRLKSENKKVLFIIHNTC